jgi:hypothetical protein
VRDIFWHYWFFFEDDAECAATVSTEQHKIIVENFLVNELHHHELPVRFQQEGQVFTLHE